MDRDALARAWELKAACYDAWHSEPPRTRTLAEGIAALAANEPAAQILEALAAWTDGIALLAEGRLEQALARLRQAQAVFASMGDAQHAAETQVPQMVALSCLGREHEVVGLAHEALATFLASGDERSAAKIEINLGTTLSRLDRHVEAEAMYRHAAGRFDSQGETELGLMAAIGLANTLTWQFRLEEALAVAADARRQAQDSGLSILHAQTLEATGRIELNRGRWPEALAALAAALRLLESAGASPQRRLECETALADAYAAVSLLQEAHDLYRRIVAEADALPAPNEAAWAELQCGRVLARSGRYDEALASLARAREQYVGLDNRPSVALADLCGARIELALDRPAQALRTAGGVAESLQGSGIRGWWLEARVIEAMGRLRSGDVDSAAAAFRSVLDDAAGLPQVAFECHFGLGMVLQGRDERAAARQAFESSLHWLDLQREALPADDLRSALGLEAEQVHEALIGVALEEGNAARLLADIERGRARALGQGLLAPGSSGPAREAAAASDAPRLQALHDAWREAMNENDPQRLAVLDERIAVLERTLLEEHRRHGLRAAGQPSRLAPQPQGRGTAVASARPHALQGPALGAALDISSLQQRLGSKRALVLYHLHGDRLATVVVTRREVAFRTAPAAGLAGQVAGLRLQIEAMRHPQVARRHGALVAQRMQVHAQALEDRLWSPVQALTVGCEEVVVVPHGALHDLPFALLHDGRRWLAQRVTLSLAPSAAVWLALAARRPAASAGRTVAVGAPGPGLAHVEREIDSVAAALGPAVVMLRGEEATAARVRQAVVQGVDILHLACHARFRADNPAFSDLLLSDGPLPVHELARWRLSARLVVLSACETGVSRITPGDEARGLVRATMLAGASAVVATQWAVDDEATAGLIGGFYGRLRFGEAPAQALRHAQEAAAAKGAHPFYWGAFALYGHAPRAIERQD